MRKKGKGISRLPWKKPADARAAAAQLADKPFYFVPLGMHALKAAGLVWFDKYPLHGGEFVLSFNPNHFPTVKEMDRLGEADFQDLLLRELEKLCIKMERPDWAKDE